MTSENQQPPTGTPGVTSNVTLVPLLAGQKPDGELIFEQIPAVLVEREDQQNCYRLLASPAFCPGVAKGDLIQTTTAGGFEVLERSGNLCIRVIAQTNLEAINQQLTPELAAVGGSQDLNTGRILVFSVPVAAGFEHIEAILNRIVAGREQAVWLYGNVYDAVSRQPLNWW